MKVLFIIVVAVIAVLVYWFLFPSKKKKREDAAPGKGKAKVFEIGEVLVTALILALIIRALAVQAFTIPSGSMIPTLLIGDYVLVNKFIYGPRVPFTNSRFFELKSPKRGEVIVFKYPKDHSRDFIKRVIGTPGDVVEERDKVIYVNGRRLDEPYARHVDNFLISARTSPRDNFGPITVPADKYFVMGDNRDQSEDSRFWGFVDIDEIKGKAFIIYWSADVDRTPLISIGNFERLYPPRLGRIGDLITNPINKEEKKLLWQGLASRWAMGKLQPPALKHAGRKKRGMEMLDFVKKLAVIVSILFVVYCGFMFGMPYYRYYAFKTDAADIVRFQYKGVTDREKMEKLEKELVERGLDVGLPIGVHNVKVERTETGYWAKIKWKEIVDILGQYQKTLEFEVEVSS